MSNEARVKESVVERVARELRTESPPPEMVAEAAARVWSRVAAAAASTAGGASAAHRVPDEGQPLRSCADYQALMPSLVDGSLPKARRLLVEDHTRECIPCRRALHAARAGRSAEATVSASPRPSSWLRAASVAGAALGAGLLAWMAWTLVPVSQTGAAEVKSVDGQLFVVDESGRQMLLDGSSLSGGEEIHTAQDSGAVVRLADGSLVEIAERSSVRFRVHRSGTTIRIARGSIIVEASEQGAGHLDVSTDELLVSVKGTIFAVSHGTKGSRVSVIEGEVRVEHGKEKKTLYPGEQLGTRHAAALSFEEELAWSRNVGHYLEVLRELAGLRRALNQLIAAQQPRHSTRLLDLAPAGTVVYVAIPNPTVTMAEAYRLLRERVAANPRLSAWWHEAVDDVGFGTMVDRFMEELRSLGEYLGEEVAVALTDVSTEGNPAVVLLAEVTDALALETSLEANLHELQAAVGAGADGSSLVVVDDPFATAGGGEGLRVWIAGDVLVASTSAERLREVATSVEGAANPFVATAFYGRLAHSYSAGAQYLGGVDLSRILPEVLRGEERSQEQELSQERVLELTGMLAVEHLVVEREQDEALAHTAATLSFDGERRGMVGWLAEPAPLGALDFISPDASFVSAFLVEDPATILDELYAFARIEDEDFDQRLAEVEAELGFRPEDVAVALGGEFAFAIDGPALPEPSWKLVAEVRDQRVLQNILEQAASRVNAVANGAGGLSIEAVAGTRGRTFYHLTAHVEGGAGDVSALVDGRSVVYTYHGGYLVAAPTQAMVERAIQLAEGGVSFVQSADFQRLLPADGYIDVSALVFNRLGEVLGGLFDRIASSSVELTEDQRAMISELEAEVGPSLHVAYGEPDRIRIVSNGPSALPFLGVGQLLGLSQVLSMIDPAAAAGTATWQ
jgi:ferric-dicitrate binding protein FerR (iron transport regulator)